jgi:hypothetical protein
VKYRSIAIGTKNATPISVSFWTMLRDFVHRLRGGMRKD